MKKSILLFFIFVSIFCFTNCDFYSQPENPQEKPQNQQLGRTPDPVQVVKSYTKQSCDWLIIMYVDGDNDLHDALYTDLNEIEDALRKHEEKSGEKPIVKVVALWDGYKITGSTIGMPSTQILELGPDFNINVKKLCSNTKDLTATAYSQNNNWLNYDPKTEIAEANMGDKNTLSNFLKWVDKYYDADHKILQFANHGGGPRSVTGTSLRRALCWDFSESSMKDVFLKTKDVSTALTEAGYGIYNQLDMLIFDICLGASIEDSYQFRNYAKYLVSSANLVPSYGNDYTAILDHFTNTADAKTIGIGIINDFKKFYTETITKYDPTWLSYWENEIAYWKDYIKINNLSQNPVDLAKFQYMGAMTLSLIDLSQIENVKDNINDLAKYIITNNKGINLNFKPLIDYKSYTEINKLIYQGTFTWLHDIGFFASNIYSASEKTSDTHKENLQQKSKAVIDALSNAIIFTWREGPSKKQNGGVSPAIDDSKADNSLYYGENRPYGMTISGAEISGSYLNYVDGKTPSFYQTDLDFGKDTCWADFLKLYF